MFSGVLGTVILAELSREKEAEECSVLGRLLGERIGLDESPSRRGDFKRCTASLAIGETVIVREKRAAEAGLSW